MSAEVRRTRARIAGLGRRPADDPDRLDARREHTAALLEDHIRRLVDTFPPLTTEQRDRLAGLLRPGGDSE
jgi:hypothetical protein